jgi:hypothetical protein
VSQTKLFHSYQFILFQIELNGKAEAANPLCCLIKGMKRSACGGCAKRSAFGKSNQPLKESKREDFVGVDIKLMAKNGMLKAER